MSRYFQQLLASSGLAVPAVTAPASPAPRSLASGPAPHEISEERITAPGARAAHAVISEERKEMAISRPRTSDTLLRENAPAPSAAAATGRETGIVEIVSPGMRPAGTASAAAGARSSSIPPPAPSLSQATVIHDVRAEVSATPTPVGAPSAPVAPLPSAPASGAPAAGVTSAELIQHVLRWVGQNPGTVVPSALGDRPTLVDSAQSLSDAVTQPEPSARPAAAPATRVSLPSSAPALSPAPTVSSTVRPVPAPGRPPAPAPASAAQDSTVEISIGTLQIHVDSPPAPKAVRRPTAPRPPTRGQPAAVAPAIDLNRLRRGFYL